MLLVYSFFFHYTYGILHIKPITTHFIFAILGGSKMQTPATPGTAPTARSRRAFPATLSEGELRSFARACGEDVKQACKMFFLYDCFYLLIHDIYIEIIDI